MDVVEAVLLLLLSFLLLLKESLLSSPSCAKDLAITLLIQDITNNSI
jgi:hypothetical protein